jgi:hypothetical protein
MRNPLLALLAVLCACSGRDAAVCKPIADGGAGTPLARPILAFDTAAVAAANRASLPAGFTMPLQTACSSDPTRPYIAELADHPITDAKVPFHWAPIVPGPIPGRNPVGQPEFFVSGSIADFSRSTLDVPFDHPFGYDSNFNVLVDPEFAFLVYPPSTPASLHTEIERGLYPDDLFDYLPAAGDRVLLRGAWIFDCGHPPYSTEMHPPTFLAFARADGATTLSLAFVNPYRVTQSYAHTGPPAIDFSSTDRYAQSKPFPEHLLSEVLAAANGQSTRIEAHVLLEPTRFDTLTFTVCAPSPRPAGASLGFSYRFTSRTGVTLQATPQAADGCVRFAATMGASYQPFVPNRMDTPFPWDQVSQEATDVEGGPPIDVRQKILDALHGFGFNGDYVALHPDQSPFIDTYPALKPRAGASSDSPTELVTGADDQPFPFYGRARVFWCGG